MINAAYSINPSMWALVLALHNVSLSQNLVISLSTSKSQAKEIVAWFWKLYIASVILMFSCMLFSAVGLHFVAFMHNGHIVKVGRFFFLMTLVVADGIFS